MSTMEVSIRRRKLFLVGLAMWLTLGYGTTRAQVVPPLTVLNDQPEKRVNLSFRDSPLDMVLDQYSTITGRTMLKSAGINATISLRSQTTLTETEALQAIESVLQMHNVALVPMGDRFLRVVQPTAVRQEGMPIEMEIPEDALPNTDRLRSQVIHLKHVDLAEVQTIIQPLIHGYGKIQPLERTNSIMVTDTEANVARILEILELIDQPIETREDIFVRRILHAEAGEVASRLNEFIQDQQDQQSEQRARVATPASGQEQPAAPPGVIRPTRPDAPQANNASLEAAANLAERGVIQGKVKIVADERINTLFIISRPVNFAFFDRVIDVLDQPIDPEVIVRVIALEYAEAEEIAGILNEFIGAASSESPTGATAAGTEPSETGGRAEALRDFAAGIARNRTQQEVLEQEASKIGRLSSNTKILSDTRTNALLLMGRKGDIDALENIVSQLDIMLGQVLIEAVIVEISLGKNVETGVDWLQRTLTAYNEQVAGPAGGLPIRDPTFAFGGRSAPGGLSDLGNVRDDILEGIPPGADGGLTYFLTFFDLNVDAVVRLAASSRDARILSTPVILTTDNTEAKIIVGESRPVVTSTSASTVGDRQVSNYQFRDIGINLTVTPRINPQRFVVMEIAQSADNVGGFETIDGNRVPIITKRELSAQIAVRSRSTIVLGGLVNTDRAVTTAKVPLLGDIPLLGRLFRSDSVEDTRTELLVLITPYVMLTPDEARAESTRLHGSSHSSQTEWHLGWSDSEFATPLDNDTQYMWDRKKREQRRDPLPITTEMDREEVRQLMQEIRKRKEEQEQEEEDQTNEDVEESESSRLQPLIEPDEEPEEDEPEEVDADEPVEGEIQIIPWEDPNEPVPMR